MAAAPAAPATPEIADSLIEQAASAPAPTEPEAPKAEGEEAPASTEAPPPEQEAPVSYELAFPDDIDPSTVNEERIGTLKSILAESKVPAEKGQELLNMHLDELRAMHSQTVDSMVQAFNDQQAQRVAEVKADPQLGGARLETAMGECMQVIRRFGGDEAEQAALRAELKASGLGNSARFLRLLNNVYQSALKEGAPVATPPARSPVPSREQRGLSRYNGSAAR